MAFTTLHPDTSQKHATLTHVDPAQPQLSKLKAGLLSGLCRRGAAVDQGGNEARDCELDSSLNCFGITCGIEIKREESHLLFRRGVQNRLAITSLEMIFL